MENVFGFLLMYSTASIVVGAVLVALTLGYLGSPLVVWAIFVLALMAGVGAPMTALIAVAVLAAIFIIPPIRKILVTSFIMKVMKNVIPEISATEKTALEAGVVWSEAELFSGRPNFTKLMKE